MTVKYKCFLFDLDGTIIESGPGIFNALRYSLKKNGYPEPDVSLYRKCVGPPINDIFGMFGVPPEDYGRMVNTYREYYAPKGLFENTLYEGIPEALAGLKSTGGTVCLATSKPEQYAVEILRAHKIDTMFDCIAGASMDGKISKKSDVIIHCMELMNIKDTSDVVMIGDRKYDIIGAKTLGMASAGVLYGYGELEELVEAGADYIIPTVADIVKTLA